MTTKSESVQSGNQLLNGERLIQLRMPALRTGDDAAVAARFVELFHEAQNGLRRVVAFGLYAWHIKLNCLKHSQFGAWAEAIGAQNDISYRSVRSHMNLTKSVLESCGVKSLKPFMANWQSKLAEALPISRCGDLLLLPAAKVPETMQPLREKICSLIDGKSANQLFLEFKQADEEDDKPKRGRLKGQGGASKHQRETAAQREEAARLEELEIHATETTEWLLEVSDDKHLGLVSDKARSDLLAALDTAASYLRRFAKGVAR